MTDPQKLLTRMLVATINAREVESDRVSRTLHDEVGQVLSAVGLQLDVLRLDFQKQAPEIAPRTVEIQKMLEESQRLIKEAHERGDDCTALLERHMKLEGIKMELSRALGIDILR